MRSHLAKSLSPSDTRKKLLQSDAQKTDEDNENLNRKKKGKSELF
jgi:hypothetical protein